MPSWAYLVILTFAALLAWPAFEGRVLRTLRRVRRRLKRGRYRSHNSARRSTPAETPLARTSRQ